MLNEKYVLVYIKDVSYMYQSKKKNIYNAKFIHNHRRNIFE